MQGHRLEQKRPLQGWGLCQHNFQEAGVGEPMQLVLELVSGKVL